MWALMAESLLITTIDARSVIEALEIQGYIKQAENNPNEWLTTINGESVSGSKQPRFNRGSVENALSSLQERIDFVNKDAASPYIVTKTVAFGDFLAKKAQAQAADVGIELLAHKVDGSAAKGMQTFLKKLRAREFKLNLTLYEPWMSGRSHLALFPPDEKKRHVSRN